ncbi:hypothetical protein M011DRAFT_137272 [Sporormia fimetaria CBS 119925]|uniref:Uncharacterized protein n=1 Tax=Sporormia fimetaria CBS 119925 TaxID=1340428 RepID=A0A6A6V603_9PLEO|nr:hypothetical protein M011DRAFT_137272 [Sporormia fimetaria CBS 119925]
MNAAFALWTTGVLVQCKHDGWPCWIKKIPSNRRRYSLLSNHLGMVFNFHVKKTQWSLGACEVIMSIVSGYLSCCASS